MQDVLLVILIAFSVASRITVSIFTDQKVFKIFTYFQSDIYQKSGFGGLGVAFWPLVPKFAGSNPAEAVGFLRAKKSSARLP